MSFHRAAAGLSTPGTIFHPGNVGADIAKLPEKNANYDSISRWLSDQ